MVAALCCFPFFSKWHPFLSKSWPPRTMIPLVRMTMLFEKFPFQSKLCHTAWQGCPQLGCCHKDPPWWHILLLHFLHGGGLTPHRAFLAFAIIMVVEKKGAKEGNHHDAIKTFSTMLIFLDERSDSSFVAKMNLLLQGLSRQMQASLSSLVVPIVASRHKECSRKIGSAW